MRASEGWGWGGGHDRISCGGYRGGCEGHAIQQACMRCPARRVPEADRHVAAACGLQVFVDGEPVDISWALGAAVAAIN